jgi:hypothetical protein
VINANAIQNADFRAAISPINSALMYAPLCLNVLLLFMFIRFSIR